MGFLTSTYARFKKIEGGECAIRTDLITALQGSDDGRSTKVVHSPSGGTIVAHPIGDAVKIVEEAAEWKDVTNQKPK